MPLLFVIIFAVLVNLSSFAQAQESATKIRGPRSSDVPPAPLTVGPLSPSDTLWRVAERIRPDASLSLYQVMYALYQKNPDAFLDNNLNHLRPGSVLILPTKEEIQQINLELAKQKSEQDDKEWAQRQKAAKVAKPNKNETTDDAVSEVSAAKWQAEIAQLSQQQRQELDGLRTQFADSLQQIEAMANENVQLKTSLLKVEQELALIKAQLADDAQMQQQIEQLIKQQAELLAAKAAQDAALAEEQKNDWTQWFKSPIAWILAACIPALMVLFGILLWVKKRSKYTEEVIQAAASEPAANPAYQSPLPPLDDSNDLDESLFEIDDALLEDAFNDSNSNDAPSFDDDLLEMDDTLSLDDDALSFEDDSLLPPDNAGKGSLQVEDNDNFDPDNILSDTDLSALLAAEDDDDAIIELADDALEDETVDNDNLDDLLASNAPKAESATAQTDPTEIVSDELYVEPDEFDVDDLIEEIDLDADDDLAEPVVAPQLQEQQLTQALAEPEQTVTSSETDIALDIDADAFDSSELEEFAESLVSETVDTEALLDEVSTADEELLNSELADILDQAEQERSVTDDNSDSGTQNHDVAGDHDIQQLAADIAEDPLSDDDIASLLEANVESTDLTEDTTELAGESLSSEAAPDTELITDDSVDSDPLATEPALSTQASDEELVDNAEAIAADEDLLLADEAEQDSAPLAGLDLSKADDESVSPVTEATLSVENPSKMLDQYPELELADEDLASADQTILDMPELDADLLLQEFEQGGDELNDNLTDEIEQDPLPDAQFDSLMSELEAMADNLDAAEQAVTLESELALSPEVEGSSNHDFSDDDFVEIDSLLANAEQNEQDTERFEQLNVDVGLEDYAGIIGEHERRDVDIEDNGYSAKLDLVRAYIEIDDFESADLLLDEIIASDAPEHVKKEAQSLRR